MLDFSTPFGKRMEQRLNEDQIIWLTTVDARGAPQPRPVWFHWDGETILIFSVNDAAKMRHIARNPRVALNFNSDEDGGDVGVLLGEAKAAAQPVSAERLEEYLAKYAEGITDLKMTGDQFAATYNDRILVTPSAMRGFV